MPMTSLAAPPLVGANPTTEPIDVLAKRVNELGKCTTAVVSEADDPWFPVTRVRQELVAAAKRACAGCLVTDDCLEMTLQLESDLPEARINGIFGAKAAHERLALIRARRNAGGVAR